MLIYRSYELIQQSDVLLNDIEFLLHFLVAPFRGFGGPIGVEEIPWVPPAGRVAIRAGEEMGLKKIDYNTDTNIGRLLLAAVKNSAKIILNADNRAIGVKYVHNNEVKRAFAQREVIISGGAVDTPKLLMLSGIGPREHLEKLGIKTRVDLAGVGQNLQDHVMVLGLSWTINPNISTSIFARIGKSAMLDYRERRSVCALYHLNIDSPHEPHVPDTQIYMFCMLEGQLYGLASYQPLKQSVQDYTRPIYGRDGYYMTPMLARPKSVGSITLRSKNPFDPPIVDPNCLSHPDDVELMVKASKASRRLGNAKIFRSVLGAEAFNEPVPDCAHFEFESDAYWRCYVHGWSTVSGHMTSTCKMAPDSDPMGVVTPRLRVRGVKNLRVIDASVMPSVPSGNTNAPTVMIAERGADLIKEDYGKI
ncbi:hypothetical protein HAZT_HAZT005686 [Hyalella azteca]|uniref:Glucose-methanol-choline oxidoreductase N-terminal domain-containing protein n=1 Tax=Hyalella azteca TaxID=294128 RepID=A0A6A0H7D5_HYAAZ|nr:hypothetical protein HAZT_HAZT005686 [Hyalella azteca]